jgi:hypothetical protein
LNLNFFNYFIFLVGIPGKKNNFFECIFLSTISLFSFKGDLDVVIPVVFIVGVMHVLLVGFGKIKDDASYKFHENEGVVGWILVIVRLFIYMWFIWAVSATSGEASIKVRSWLRKFTAVSTLVFLAWPVMFTFAAFFPAYMRHRVMLFGMFLNRSIVYTWLSGMFLFRGEYFSLSTLNTSFLPGGVRRGLDKEE